MRVNKLIFVGVFAKLLLSCAAPPKKLEIEPKAVVKSAQNGDNDAIANISAESLKLALDEKKELSGLQLIKGKNLSTLKAINHDLCQKLFQYRQECSVSQRLIDGDSQKVLGCMDNYDSDTIAVPNFTVNVSGLNVNGPFTIMADNAFESSAFEANNTVEITWKALGGQAVKAPRLFDITELKFRDVAGNALALNNSVSFELKFGDVVLLTEKDFVASSNANSINIDVATLLAKKEIQQCKVGADDIAAIIENAKNSLPANEDVIVNNEKNVDTPDSVRAYIEEAKKTIGVISVESQREEDRHGKIIQELLGNVNQGCFAGESINTLEILIEGAHVTPKQIATTTAQRSDVGSPALFNISFSDDIAYSHADEEQQSIFISGGGLLLRNYSNFKIRDLEKIIFTKKGVGIQSLKHSWNTLFKTHYEWLNSEKNIYRLDSLAIKVNGEELYKKDGINYTFASGGLVWSAPPLRLNESYQKLMRRSDCPAK